MATEKPGRSPAPRREGVDLLQVHQLMNSVSRLKETAARSRDLAQQVEQMFLAPRKKIGPGKRTQPLPRLSPRLGQLLEHLLQGVSEKQAAAELGLSRHTIHMHVKELYRRFDVNTRSELLVKCLRG